MLTAQRMIETHPHPLPMSANQVAAFIQAAIECSQSCSACADACLGEADPQTLNRCIRLNLDCADVCDAAAKVLSRQTAFEPALARGLVETCMQACRVCAEECERHADRHEHCRVCGESCRRCEAACGELLPALASTGTARTVRGEVS